MIQGLKKNSQLQIGKDIRVELQIPPSAYLNLRGAEKILRLERGGKEVAKMFRQAEANLLSEGRYLDAFDLNANAIRDQFGDIYNEGLEDARNHFVKEVIPILEEQLKKNKQ